MFRRRDYQPVRRKSRPPQTDDMLRYQNEMILIFGTSMMAGLPLIAIGLYAKYVPTAALGGLLIAFAIWALVKFWQNR